MKEALVAYLMGSRSTHTATQLSSILTECGHRAKLSSLSSLLKKLTDSGELIRTENFGPRGGYGYSLRNT